jgi:hypothetical protein
VQIWKTIYIEASLFYAVGLKKADAEIRGKFSFDAAVRLLEQAKNEGIESLIVTSTRVLKSMDMQNIRFN